MNWRKIRRPVSWKPNKPNEEITGYYIGRTVREGQYGQYEVLTVYIPDRGALMVSGTQIIQLADVAMLKYGSAIRIKFLGFKAIEGRDNPMKEFELYVSDAELTMEDVLNVKRAVDEVSEYMPNTPSREEIL